MRRREARHAGRLRAAWEARSPSAERQSRRGPAKQLPQREVERSARRGALVFTRWLAKSGGSLEEAAGRIGMPRRTLAGWDREWRRTRLRALPRGRPADRPDVQTRNEVIDMLRKLGPNVGMPTLQGLFPGIARGALWDLLSRFREICTRERNRMLHALRWKEAGTVWAMDHAEPPAPIDGKYGHAFAVRDLAAGCQLAWLPVERENSETTIKALEALLREHGTPIVIKSDNGSAFIAGETRAFLEGRGVHLLLSPPYTPEYNGSAEAGIGSMKTRTHHQAALNDRPGEWTCDDLEAARCQANETARPWGAKCPTPEEAWKARGALTREKRQAFAEDVRHWERLLSRGQGDLNRRERDSVRRRAISCVLIRRGFLEIRRRRFPLPIPG